MEGKRYPWGDAISPENANYYGIGGQDRWKNTSPVGAFPPNGYGLYDMAGNVWEYCADWYDENYYSQSPNQNPTGPATGTGRVLRGGGWFQPPASLLVTSRWSGGTKDYEVGFRCAKSP
ncbi:MAG: SUMF1/EgtB/PvdO family nonheme iron enzyme [Candidatus Latescibacteria bacterium]|nr:SUMF1/EgtB/PvdO family nonheme iron enzyme [Candidatus Latescibacterota bacterium]